MLNAAPKQTAALSCVLARSNGSRMLRQQRVARIPRARVGGSICFFGLKNAHSCFPSLIGAPSTRASRVRVLVHRPASAGPVSGPVSGSVGSEARRSSACTRVGRSSVSTSACTHTRVSWSWARLPRSCRLSPGRSRARGPARPRAPRPRGPPAGTRTRRSMAVKTGRGLVARRAALGGRARAVRQRTGLFFRHSFLHEGSVRGAPAACRALSPVKRKAGEGRKVHGRVGRDLRRPWRAAGRDPQPRGGGPWARAV